MKFDEKSQCPIGTQVYKGYDIMMLGFGDSYDFMWYCEIISRDSNAVWQETDLHETMLDALTEAKAMIDEEGSTDGI